MKKLNMKNQMRFNKWTLGLAAIGVVSLASAARADETKMSMVNTALSNTTISGFVDTAAIWRPGTDQNAATGGAPGNIPAYSFAKNDGFSVNLVDLVLDKPEDESPWASGYHVELNFGPDSVGGAFGPAGPTSNIREAYVRLRTPVGNSGIDWEAGVFGNIIGYESTSDVLDPNYTRSYAWTIEPTTHTGILGTYKVNNEVTVQAGIANSSNVGVTSPAPINGRSVYESQKAYLAMLTLTAPDSWGWMKGANFYLAAENTVDSKTAGTGTKQSWYVGAMLPTPISALKVGGSFDYLNLDNRSAGNPSDDSLWIVALYGTYQFSDKLSLNLRGEYWDNGSMNAGSTPVGGAAYANNQIEEATATLQYNLWANVISRLEFRWDHVEHGNAFGANSSGATTKGNDFMVALNLAYKF